MVFLQCETSFLSQRCAIYGKLGIQPESEVFYSITVAFREAHRGNLNDKMPPSVSSNHPTNHTRTRPQTLVETCMKLIVDTNLNCLISNIQQRQFTHGESLHIILPKSKGTTQPFPILHLRSSFAHPSVLLQILISTHFGQRCRSQGCYELLYKSMKTSIECTQTSTHPRYAAQKGFPFANGFV